jgi:hypothetical protein
MNYLVAILSSLTALLLYKIIVYPLYYILKYKAQYGANAKVLFIPLVGFVGLFEASIRKYGNFTSLFIKKMNNDKDKK